MGKSESSFHDIINDSLMADAVYKSSGAAVQLQLLSRCVIVNSSWWPRSVLDTIPMWAGRVVRLVEECVKGFGRNIAGRRQPAIHRGECKDGIKTDI